MLLHLGILCILIALGILGLQATSQAEKGFRFGLFLLLSIASLAIAPIAAYRAYALWTANYTLQGDLLRLQWGLRIEEIPINLIDWVRPINSLGYKPAMPWLPIPGALLGTRRLPNGQSIEYMASQSDDLILVSTVGSESQGGNVYAISPFDPQAFQKAYHQRSEFGAFGISNPRSVHPAAAFTNIWGDRLARILVTAMLILNLILIVWALWVVTSQSQVPFRFDVSGMPLEIVPSVRLILLPIVSLIFGVVDLLLGLVLYRQSETRNVAYILWFFGVLISGMLILAINFSLHSL